MSDAPTLIFKSHLVIFANMDVTAVDLFCGVGGLTHGFESAEIPVTAGIDIDPDCRFPFEANNDAEFVEADIAETDSEEIEALFPQDSCKILAGCAPCQPFSNLNNGKDSEGMEDWSLLREFGRLVRDIQPKIVTMENVIEIRNHQVYSRFIDTLFKHGYDISVNKVDCTNYGVPQNRKRLVILASNLGDISLTDPTHTTFEDRPTVRKTIGDDTLNPIEAGEVDNEDLLHRSQALAEKNLERIRQSEPGGTWRDWDDELVLDCHRKDSGSTYDSVYGRMEWDSAAPTITTQFYGYGSGRFGHPEQNRAISLREGAMLQTFPKSYCFLTENQDDIHFKQIGRFIGNAVPVRLAEAVGESINQHLDRHNVKDRNASWNGRGEEVRDVSQPQRVESLGTESLQ
jgi:DNA (cytosine-5)-methyltransferase 1